jgi:hypothetical protein
MRERRQDIDAAIDVPPRGRLRQDLDDECGDVVLATALIGERDAGFRAFFELAIGAELGDLAIVVVEVAVQTVAAQQESIPVFYL